MSDSSQRFLFEDLDLRGEVVQLDETLKTACANHSYPAAIARLLGEGMAAAALMRATIRTDGTLTLQVEGEEGAAVSMVLVHADPEGTLRGTVRYQGEPREGGLARLCGAGRLAITIEPENGQRYQGIVGLDEKGLAATLEGYFHDSEQLPSRLHLACDGERAGGMLIQQLPPESRSVGERERDPDAWARIGYLAETLSDRELLERDHHEILHRLFHQETVRVFEAQPLAFRCRCSGDRIAAVLRGLGREEVEQVLAEEGAVEVRCEFCGARYRYDSVDVAQVLADVAAAPGSDSYH